MCQAVMLWSFVCVCVLKWLGIRGEVEGFLVFWDVMLAGQVVADVLEAHVAFIFWHKPIKEVCTVKVSGTACPTAQCHISEDRML